MALPSPSAADLVDHQLDHAPVLLAGQHLDRGVGIGQRGRFGRRDDQHIVGERHGVQHHVRDAGAGVEQDAVVARRHRLDHVQQLVAHLGRQARILDQAGAGEQHVETARRGQQCLVQRRLAGEDVVQRRLRVEVQHHVEVGEAEVGIEHQHAFTAARQGRREVGRDEGLAHATLAAGDGNDAGTVTRLRGGLCRGRDLRRTHSRS